MGYTTEFEGQFNLNKKLDDDTFIFLCKFNETRRMKRKVDSKYGIDGEFYVDGGGDFGQDREASIVSFNDSPSTQPGLWCQWRPTADGKAIEWDGGEKFYEYIEWIKYLITNILEPKGYILSGEVAFQGEEDGDFGKIVIKDNVVKLKHGFKDYTDEQDV